MFERRKTQRVHHSARSRSGRRRGPALLARAVLLAALLLASLPLLVARASTPTPAVSRDPLAGSPIKHVVVIFQENHSFNDLLGRLCVEEGDRCKGTTTGVISDGTKIPLGAEPDVVPSIGHLYADQAAALDHGKMDGWDRVRGCAGRKGRYHCLVQAEAGAVPTLWSLADTYAISDRTFESSSSASWGSHIQLVAATLDGFVGDPYFNVSGIVKGNACEGKTDAAWWDRSTGHIIDVPACIPDKKGNGPYRPSPVRWVPTIMDRMDAAGRSWRIYAPGHGGAGYGWSICPTFWECSSTSQAENVLPTARFAKDAAAGSLPALSIVIPTPGASQHNGNSLMKGDNYIARIVGAVMGNSTMWNSTAIFITWDDCGCFYDGVKPPEGLGIRVPMVLVSPWTKTRYVDHTVASYDSMLSFTEHLFGLKPLGKGDATAYDYSSAFNFDAPPRPPIPLPQHRVPASSLRYMASHPADPDDPT